MDIVAAAAPAAAAASAAASAAAAAVPGDKFGFKFQPSNDLFIKMICSSK